MEKDASQALPFLDVKIAKDNGQFLTAIYKKTHLQVNVFAGIHLDHQNTKLA